MNTRVTLALHVDHAQTFSMETWTVRKVLTWMQQDFEKRGLSSARLDAELLLAEALGIQRVGLYMDMNRPMSDEERAKAREFVMRRRAYEPVAYLLGRRSFYGRDFEVNPSVLVPRPDTETLVEAALGFEVEMHAAGESTLELDGAPDFVDPDEAEGESRLELDPAEEQALSPAEEEASPIAADVSVTEREMTPSKRVLDIGTGSGCVAISIAAERPTWFVEATDISKDALAVARRNAEALDVRVDFHQVDLFGELTGPYDLIVSNPPYIAPEEGPSLMPDVRDHEPGLALFAGNDGYAIIDRILVEAIPRLSTSGGLLMEVGETQAREVARRAEKLGYRATLTKDLAGIERVVTLRR